MSGKNIVTDAITETLKQPTARYDSGDCLHADIQQVKSQIHAAFSNQQHQLQLREQWLLDQVDNITECLTLVSQKNAEKVAEVKGKLLCCIEASKFSQLKDCKNFEKLVSNLINTYKNLTSQEADKSPQITFNSDDIAMSNMIRRFGNVTSNALHVDDASSDCSWDLGENDLDITTAKHGAKDFVDCGKLCHGDSCSKPGVAIEDLNQFFSDAVVLGPLLADVCKANETCATFDDCICDMQCGRQSLSGDDRPQLFVTAIGNAFDAIIDGDQSLECIDNDPSMQNCSQGQKRFDEQILSLEMQFQQILSGDYVSTDSEMTSEVRKPWSADVLACEIDAIIHRSEKNALTTTCNVEVPQPLPFQALTQQLTSILNGEMPMFGVNSEIDDSNPVDLDVPGLSKQLKTSLNDQASDYSEKIDHGKLVGEFPKKWTTPHELDSIMAGILNE